MTRASLAVALCVVASQAMAQEAYFYVTAETLNVRLCPDTSCPVTNRLHRRQRVEVYETKEGWARISPYYDAWAEKAEFPEIKDDVVARWVAQEFLSRNQSPLPAQPNFPAHLMDSRIEGIPEAGQFGLDEDDVLRLRKYAYRLIQEGECSSIDVGDKSVQRPGTYFVHCEGESRNRFFTLQDVD